MIQLKFSALNQFANLPVRKHDGDAGMDVTAMEQAKIVKGVQNEQEQH